MYYELLQIPNTISVGMAIGHEGANIRQLRQCLVELIADKREVSAVVAPIIVDTIMSDLLSILLRLKSSALIVRGCLKQSRNTSY